MGLYAAGNSSALMNSALVNTEDSNTLGKHMRELVKLRWVAVLGQLLTIVVTHYSFGIELPLRLMFTGLAVLVFFNALYEVSFRVRRRIHARELLLGLVVDMITLTFQLYLSGGVANPFVFLYLFQVAMAGVLMAAPYAWALLGLASLCFFWLAERAPTIDLPHDYSQGLDSYYVQGMFICLLLNAALVVVFVNRINRNRREHDARLAELRQRSLEGEHILRMGLLASGAAHELGTPLATIAVILGDWRHMPALMNDPTLREEVEDMQTQVARCKSIVSGILLSAGETRGEESEETSVCEFFEQLTEEWQQTRKTQAFHFDNEFGDDVDIASDSVLKQTVCNLLDNALEASPTWVGLRLSRQQDTVLLQVLDRGPGFDRKVIENLGKPYQSTKGRPGSGLGLFLVFNVAHILGGQVSAKNLPEGGAEVSLRLPLSALRLKEDGDDPRR